MRPRALGTNSVLALALTATLAAAAPGARASGGEDLHSPWDALLSRYVEGGLVRYRAWAGSKADLHLLDSYLARLVSVDPGSLSRDEALAYWIDLYNAATVQMVLSHYPVESIKDIGGPSGSVWKMKVVHAGGRDLSLDAIENDIIRPRFQDARVHFALNCASLGCPPLASRAYRGATLDAQLDEACRTALGDSRWVDLTDRTLRVTKIFDWYAADFEHDGDSVRGFLARYRPQDAKALLDPDRKLEYIDYDWSLNQAPASP